MTASVAALSQGPVPWLERLRLTPARLAEWLVCTAIVLLPVLVPSGPGNTGPVDLLILVAVAVLALDSLAYGTPMRLPYAVPVLILVLSGGVAALYRERPVGSGLALAQDVVLLLWGATVASTARSPQLLRTVIRVWVLAAVAWASVLVVAVGIGWNSLAGITAQEGGRAGLTFGDPNRAGSYFAISFLLLCTGWPSRRLIRWACGAVMLLALAYTGSNAAIVSVVVAAGFAACVRVVRRRGTVAGIGVTAFGVLVFVLAATSIDFASLTSNAKQSGRILANSVARSEGGAADRQLLLSENLALYRDGDNIVGAGPGGTKALLQQTQAPYVKEAHNDYLAALIERGAMGAVGVVCLWFVVGLRCAPLCSRALSRRLFSVVARPEMIAAAALSAATFGWFHEALHFRHVWAALGIVAAASVVARDRNEV